MKNRVGDGNSIFKNLGSSSHAKGEREENDYYSTDPIAIDLLFEQEDFNNIREPACGEGHLSKRMIELGKSVKSSDLIDRGYGIPHIDFLEHKGKWFGDIITNPPYKYAQQFVEKANDMLRYDGCKVAMFLKVLFLEGKKRKVMFEKYLPKVVYVSSSRIKCGKNGVLDDGKSSAVAYAWFVWEKGYDGDTIIKWIN